MIPHKYQYEYSAKALKILLQHDMVYLAMEERTGKTVISLLVCQELNNIDNILVITKKKAMQGWYDTIYQSTWFTKNIHVINYESIHNLGYAGNFFDLIILDEAHTKLSAVPKPTKTHKEVHKYTKDTPIIYVSATPYAQGYHQLFHQFSLSNSSPWKQYKNYYRWYDAYAKRNNNGDFYTIHTSMFYGKDYTKIDESKVLPDVEHLFVRATRKELGFPFEPQDKLHYIQLNDKTKKMYNKLRTDRVLTIKRLGGTSVDYLADTGIKLRCGLHMIEGATLKTDEGAFISSRIDKINYIQDTWGDTEDLCIMHNYVAEGALLSLNFTKAVILQGTANAEGIDLSHIKNLVIYSQDFSTAKHIQRRARQANRNRTEDIIVHFILVKGAISEQVYNTVSLNKKNYTDTLYEDIKI